MRVLVVGMGLMGSSLADALLAAGHGVHVWNRTASRCRPSVEAGAVHAEDVAAGARSCDVIVSCLANASAVHDTVTTDDVGQAASGRILVQLSQATPDQSLEFAAWAAGHDIGYLDGSILAYPKDVRAGVCDIVYSGEPETFEACRPVLQAMGGRPHLVGARPGIATAFDKAFFAFYYGHIMGLLHGAAICRATGVPLETFLDLMVDNWDWRLPDSVTASVLRQGDYGVREGALETHAHAFGQVAPFCRGLGVDTRMAEAIDAILSSGIRAGHGSDEIASLIEVLAPSGKAS